MHSLANNSRSEAANSPKPPAVPTSLQTTKSVPVQTTSSFSSSVMSAASVVTPIHPPEIADNLWKELQEARDQISRVCSVLVECCDLYFIV
jgi:hypothetical protein